eukprot:3050963-Rhodomonas_salina.1
MQLLPWYAAVMPERNGPLCGASARGEQNRQELRGSGGTEGPVALVANHTDVGMPLCNGQRCQPKFENDAACVRSDVLY